MANPLYDALVAPHRDSDAPFFANAPDGGQTYGGFAQDIHRMAGALRDLGVAPGERVLVQAAKSADVLALYFACIQSGAVFVPLNTAYTPVEVDYFVRDAEPSLVVVDPSALDAVRPSVEAVGARLKTLVAMHEPDSGPLALGIDAVRATPERVATPRREDDLAAILYTSGTTGRSKGAMLTQGNLLSNARALLETWRFTADDVLLHALPIYHAHGLFVACNVSFLAGCAMIFLPRFDPSEVIAQMPRATTMMGVPTFYTRLLDAPGFTRETAARMRLFISGSAPLLASTHAAFEERTGHRILERYGMSETGMNSSNPYEAERRPGSVGPPLPGVEIRVTDPAVATEKPAGETGMVEVRGPNVFQGYWRMPEKTAEELRDDGWFITGDLGVLSDDGYLTIVGRQKDLIISGGLNIYPKEVEQRLDALSGVIESAVVGAPHPDFGEAVVAVIVAEAGADLTAESVVDALRADLAAFKRPKAVFFVDTLPRNTMGKVQKNVLRERYATLFAA